MKKDYYVVAFIDILGFKDHIDKYFSGADTRALDKVNEALTHAEKFGIDFAKAHLKQFELKFSFKQFSDSVSISMPIKFRHNYDFLTVFGAFANVVRVYQYILLDNDIYVRGGISMGEHIEKSKTVFSQALANSYLLETQRAIYPRILIDGHILTALKKEAKESPELFKQYYQLYGKSIIQDWDSECFLSPFGLIEELKYLISAIGADAVKSILQPIAKAHNLAATDIDISQINGSDVEMISSLLVKVQQHVADKEGKPDIQLKYKWLSEFMKWNIDPEHSKIKFDRYFQS